MGKKKKGGKKKGKAGGFNLKAPPEAKPLSSVRVAGLALFDNVALQPFNETCPQYTTFLAEKAAAEAAAEAALKPAKKTAGTKKGGKKKGTKKKKKK